MDLTQVADALYGADPDAFVEERAARVARARIAKDKALAREIAALRKPTRGAWLVNLLAREADEELADLLDLGPALREAMTGSVEELREVTSLRRAAVSGLVRRAVGLGRERGYVATSAVTDEVSRTLDAALSQEGVAEAVRAGVLVKAPESAAAFPLDLFAFQPRAVPDVVVVQEPEPEVEPASVEDESAARAEEERAARIAEAEEAAELAADALASAREALTDAAESSEQTEAAVSEASEAQAAVADEVSDLRARLTEAEQRLAAQDEVLAAARQAAKEAAERLAEAREAESVAGAEVLAAEAAVEMARHS